MTYKLLHFIKWAYNPHLLYMMQWAHSPHYVSTSQIKGKSFYLSYINWTHGLLFFHTSWNGLETLIFLIHKNGLKTHILPLQKFGSQPMLFCQHHKVSSWPIPLILHGLYFKPNTFSYHGIKANGSLHPFFWWLMVFPNKNSCLLWAS